MYFNLTSYVHPNGKSPDQYIEVGVEFAEDEYEMDNTHITIEGEKSGSRSLIMTLDEFDFIASEIERARTNRAILAELNPKE